jgi:hypothetical protein
MKINLKDGHIDAYNFKLTSKRALINSSDTSDEYFWIKNKDGSKKLINMSNTEYYLHSDNYVYDEKNKVSIGTSIDLSSGTILTSSSSGSILINSSINDENPAYF